MASVIVCSDCRGRFRWDINGGNPKFCVKCGASFGNDPDDDDVCMPAFLTPKGRGPDDVYRAMEKGSEFRAQHAADKLGVPVSEMSDLKITDFNNRTPAPVNNAVTQAMAMAPNLTGAVGSQGVEYSGAVQSGPYPNAGARMRSIIHGQHASEVTKFGLPLNNISSEMPAVETLQPGYRRRG